MRRVRDLSVVCIYMHVPAGPWLYIVSGYMVLEHSRSPTSPHKMITHRIDDLGQQHTLALCYWITY